MYEITRKQHISLWKLGNYPGRPKKIEAVCSQKNNSFSRRHSANLVSNKTFLSEIFCPAASRTAQG